MADKLNKNRMRDTRILMVLTLVAGVSCQTRFPAGTSEHLALEVLGFALTVVCAIGRIYVSTFIGGVKNARLITTGPYTLCRNPLYLFSLCGALGIGLMTTSLVCATVIFTGFYVVYLCLIEREEGFLREKFGADFEDFVKSTPRLLPDFKKFSCPMEMTFQPRFLTNAVKDAVWWFVPLPVFLLVDYLQTSGLYTPPFHLF
jgi:protein-S-isoprenylcysteine O-methyltransferase Ste14